jgi:hypothetical protein
MTSGEVLDTSLGVARNLGGQFLRVSLIPTFFCLAALDFIFGYALPQLQYTQRPDSTSGQLGEAIFAIGLVVLVGGPNFLIGASYAGGIVSQLTSDFILGESSDLFTIEGNIRSRLGTIFLCGMKELFVCFGCLLLGGAILMVSGLVASSTSDDTLVAGILALLGGFALFGGCIAALILFARRAIVYPIVIIEKVGVKAAGLRVKTLMKSVKSQPSGASAIANLYAITVIGFGAIYAGLAGIIELFGIEGIVRGWSNHSLIEPLLVYAVWLIPAFCAVWVLLPFWSVVLTVVYYERRIRVEGFDIEQLAEEIGRDGRTNRFNV